jgi:hypothetical protein
MQRTGASIAWLQLFLGTESSGAVSYHPPQSVTRIHCPLLGSAANASAIVEYAVACDSLWAVVGPIGCTPYDIPGIARLCTGLILISNYIASAHIFLCLSTGTDSLLGVAMMWAWPCHDLLLIPCSPDWNL